MKHLIEAGLKAVLSQEQAAPIARENPVDKFILWASRYAEEGIVGAFNCDDDEECKWMNRFCNGRRDHNENWRPCKLHGQVLSSICRKAYKQLTST
jgi:hypothetical protein